MPTGDPGPLSDDKILHSLGKDPKTGREVNIKFSRYGVFVELAHKNSNFVRSRGNLEIKGSLNKIKYSDIGTSRYP